MKTAWILAIFSALVKISSSTGVAESASKIICHDNVCYPAVFEPAEDFALVQPDQSIPAGLHVRINLETGMKEARLLRPEDADSGETPSSIAIVPGHETEESTVNEDRTEPKPYPPTKPLYGSDMSSFEDALAVLESSSVCNIEVEEALDTLEDLVHELEFGLKMVDEKRSKGFELLLHLLQPSGNACRGKAALVLGSALRNNANALAALPKDFLLADQLLALLRAETDGNVQKMFIYALSAVMGQERSKAEFKASNGHEVLIDCYRTGSGDLKGKVASFVEDHFAQVPDRLAKIKLQDDAAYENGLLESEALGNWCDEFQRSLLGSLSSVSSREKLLSSVTQIKRTNMDVCTATTEFLNYLSEASQGKSGEAHESVTALARSARSLFGNIKASRKHQAEYL